MTWKCQAYKKDGTQCKKNSTEKGCHLYCSHHAENTDSLDKESLKDLVGMHDYSYNSSLQGVKKNGKISKYT